MTGSNLLSPIDKMVKVQEDYIYHSLRKPKPVIEARIRQLRTAYQINPKMYAQQKRSLPYLVCGMFNPPHRRTENFAYTERFIIDIDHLADKFMDITETRQKIQTDPRVMMCFVSPSEDGLKVMFKLKERCYDAGIYSIFYKEFLKRFAEKHRLLQVADKVTSDVTRACFVSVDPEAYYNSEAEPVDINDYLNAEDTFTTLQIKKQQDDEERKMKKIQKIEKKDESHDPDKEIMDNIRQRLNPNAKKICDRPPAYVPQQLQEITDDIKKYIEETGLVVTEIISIQYGKKFRVKMGLKEAELNVFFGKRGFSVVKSPRSGTNSELNDVVAELVSGYLTTH